MTPSVDGFLDGKPHEFPCKTCDAVLKTTVGEARRASALHCPNGHRLEFDPKEFDESIRKSEQNVANIMNRFTFG